MKTEEGQSSTMKGWWTIGIQGHTTFNYTIAVMNSEVSLIEVHPGVPMSYDQKTGQEDPPVFKYHHRGNSSFYIVLEED